MSSTASCTSASVPTTVNAASMYFHHDHHARSEFRRCPVAPQRYKGSTMDSTRMAAIVFRRVNR
jgi:hypothetical protein